MTLDKLKPGDKVVVFNRDSIIEVCTVEKITPKGNIRTKYGLFKNTTGFQKTNDAWNMRRIKPFSEELGERIKRLHVIGKIKTFNFSSLPNEVLFEVYEIINKWQKSNIEKQLDTSAG